MGFNQNISKGGLKKVLCQHSNILKLSHGKRSKSNKELFQKELLLGNYSSDQWGSNGVRPFHEEIAKARSSGGKSGGGGRYQSRNKKKGNNKIKAARRKLSKLKREVENLEEKKRNISGVSAENATPPPT